MNKRRSIVKKSSIEKKIEHLPIKEWKDNGSFYCLDAIEIVELTFKESTSNDTRYGTISQEKFPIRKIVRYIAGRTKEGILAGNMVDEDNTLVGHADNLILQGILDYKIIIKKLK